MSGKFIVLYVACVVVLLKALNWSNIPDIQIRGTRGYLKYKTNEHGEVLPYKLHIVNPFGGDTFIKDLQWAYYQNYKPLSESIYYVDVNGNQYENTDIRYVANFLLANLYTFVIMGFFYVIIYGSP